MEDDQILSRHQNLSLGLRTSDVTLISHSHGRNRRNERTIDKKELQAAIKYGSKEKAAPGRKGEERWKYTHAGVVYVTDSTSRQEVTSWRINDRTELRQFPLMSSDLIFSSHTIIVVDCSGSMRTGDCPGYPTRTKCTYELLAKEFIEPQIALTEKLSDQTNLAVISLIEMRSKATILLKKAKISNGLLAYIRGRGDLNAYSHGHYLPALDAVLRIVNEDLNKPMQYFVFFLSDGAPSDHIEMMCDHGITVWGAKDIGQQKVVKGKLKAVLNTCVSQKQTGKCRLQLMNTVVSQVIEKVNVLGDTCGRDRIRFNTVGFGDPKEDFFVLEQVVSLHSEFHNYDIVKCFHFCRWQPSFL